MENKPHWTDGLVLDQLLLDQLEITRPESARLMREMFTVEERVAVIRHKAELILWSRWVTSSSKLNVPK